MSSNTLTHIFTYHIQAQCMCVCVSRFPRCQTTGYYMPPAREIRSTKQTTTTPIRTQTQSEIHTHARTYIYTYTHTHTYIWQGERRVKKSKSKSPKAFGARKYMLHLIGMISSVKYDFSLHLSKRGRKRGENEEALLSRKTCSTERKKGKAEFSGKMCGKIVYNE